jgi:hypothetical protein
MRKLELAIEYQEQDINGFGFHSTTIPAGAPILPADNLPQGGFWVQPWDGMTRKDVLWQRNVGFYLFNSDVNN